MEVVESAEVEVVCHENPALGDGRFDDLLIREPSLRTSREVSRVVSEALEQRNGGERYVLVQEEVQRPTPLGQASTNSPRKTSDAYSMAAVMSSFLSWG